MKGRYVTYKVSGIPWPTAY